jgi:hypothetical protein
VGRSLASKFYEIVSLIVDNVEPPAVADVVKIRVSRILEDLCKIAVDREECISSLRRALKRLELEKRGP